MMIKRNFEQDMMRFTLQLFEKLFSKNWSKIFSSWMWIYSYVKKYWLQIAIYTALGLFGTVFGLGVIGTRIAMYIDWVVRIIFFVWRYFSGKWMNYRLVGKTQAES